MIATLILSVRDDGEGKLAREKDARAAYIEKLQAHQERVSAVFPEKTSPAM